jgi:hypothetical protein
MDHVGEPAALELARAAAEHGADGGVRLQQGAVRGHESHADRGSVERLAKPLLARRQPRCLAGLRVERLPNSLEARHVSCLLERSSGRFAGSTITSRPDSRGA